MGHCSSKGAYFPVFPQMECHNLLLSLIVMQEEDSPICLFLPQTSPAIQLTFLLLNYAGNCRQCCCTAIKASSQMQGCSGSHVSAPSHLGCVHAAIRAPSVCPLQVPALPATLRGCYQISSRRCIAACFSCAMLLCLERSNSFLLTCRPQFPALI